VDSRTTVVTTAERKGKGTIRTNHDWVKRKSAEMSFGMMMPSKFPVLATTSRKELIYARALERYDQT
jgi:hypothetical protein